MNKKQLLPVAIALLTSQPVLASVSSSFDVDSENWQIVSFADFSQNNYSIIGQYQPSHVSGGGNPGNYLAATDPDSGDFTFSAPSAFPHRYTQVSQRLNYQEA
ncbi:hypothetical protein [Methylomonas sp. TEB]|uniref:hypothetical protein n=1 Tax=Methylomonas sp. TEB TaxID=3398229 RepID=UPI0039F57FA9